MKQRNVTPNFLRFRSTTSLIQEKAQPIQSARRTASRTKWKPRSPPNAQNAAPPKPAAAASMPTNDESCISAYSVLPCPIREPNRTKITPRWNRRPRHQEKQHDGRRRRQEKGKQPRGKTHQYRTRLWKNQ